MVSAVATKMRDENEPQEESIEFMSIYPITNVGLDVNDIPSTKAVVTKLDIFFTCFSILTHIVDVGFDLNLAIRYFINGEKIYFYWTIGFLFIPSFINIIISLRMYNQDREINQDSDTYKHRGLASKAVHNKLCWIFILVLQLAPVLRHIDSLKYAWKSRKCKKEGDQVNQRRYYIKMLKEDQDIALLRVFECFLEAAPQQILQLTIMLKNYHHSFNLQLLHQVGSICSSLVSMGWAMASFNRSIRLAQWDKSNISIVGTMLQFLWHFLITVSRIISISAVASIWVLYTSIYCAVHWIAMTIWILAEPSGAMEFCRDRRRPPHTPLTIRERIGSIMFASVLGVVYIFIYLNPTDGPTFFRHLLYYLLCLIENLIACCLWAFVATDEISDRWYFELLISLCIIPFAIGTLSMILYYKYFHPSTKTAKQPSAPNSQSQSVPI